MHNDELLLTSHPPRPTLHLWLGVLFSGFTIGLGAFYWLELRGGPEQEVVLDIRPNDDVSGAAIAQVASLVAEMKKLVEELRETRNALGAAQLRITALERENDGLRAASTPVAALQAPPPPALEEGEGGPFVALPETKSRGAATSDGEALATATEPPRRRLEPSTPALYSPKGAAIRETPSPARAAPMGSRLQACWMRDGSMVATYRVEISDEGFLVKPTWRDDGKEAWPEDFGTAMAGFKGKPLVAREKLDRAAFKKAMRPYYNFGMKQEAHCRFLVTVVDETTTDAAWQDGIALVERYFFKKIRGGGSDELAFSAKR